MTRDEWRLRHCEQQGQGKYRPNFERNPSVCRDVSPHDLIENRQRNEKHRPAPCERTPGRIGKMQGLTEQQFDEEPAIRKPAQQHAGEHHIKDGRLDLDKNVVGKPER